MELTASIQPALSEEKLYTQPLASGEQNFHPTGEHLPLTLAEIELTAIHRWQKMVERFPANRALEEGDRIQSYAELNKQMNQLAYAIMAHKLSPDQPVAILFDLESDLLTAIWAVWKAGNFFVWLEPTHPQLRNQAIIENSGAPLIVTNRHYAALARDLVPDVAYLVILEDLSADLPVSDPPITITGDTPAYLCYTSGSTGKPKGVVDNHRNLLESVMVRQVIFHFSTHDRVNLLARASGWSFSAFAALMYGGCLLPCRVVEEGFVHFSQWLIDRRVTITIGGAVLRAWLSTLDGSQQFPDLRGISLGASASYREHFQAYQQYLPDHCVFLNTYSATEVRSATFFVTGKNSQIETRLLPAGFPTYRGTIEIWDDNGKPLPVGKTGEVVVFTPYTARGYWKSPELTASRFGVDAQGRHYYRMGDLGRLDEQGCLWVLGRADGQIKIRSHRVEIAEVEVALLELPAVHETAVIYIGESDETRALIAFVAMQQKVAGQEIRSQLTAHLPDYMIPAAVIVLDELPHNANGKIARPLLRDMASALSKTVINSRSFEATSRDGTEARITKMINELLPGERIGPDDNFFDHGGHSLLAARLMLSIYHTFGVDLPPRDFLANPTIASLSASVDRALIEQAKATPTTTAETEQEIEAVELWTGSTAVLPLFICLGANGSKAVMMGYQELIRRMGNRTPIYALLPKGTNGGREPFSTMDILVDAALDALRRIQPHGPYHLIGDCHGGKLAYQLALALKAVGEEIAFLGLLDSPARPSWADAPPAVEKWMKAKHKVKAWHGRIVYHGQQLGEMGWQAAIIYLGEHIAALLPDAVRPQSSTHSQFLVHKGYQELLQSFEPYEPLDARVTAVFSHQFQHHQATWAKLIDDLDVTSIGSQHESVLRACIDETAAVIRKALLASQRPNKPE